MPRPAYQIHLGNCLDVLREMPDNSVDSVVTDPPYGLTTNKKGGTGVASINLKTPYGRARIGTGNGPGGFMGLKWDSDVPGVEVWQECLRVLKPGGHLLAFAGTRTQHRMATRIEDAGFEIRDMIAWVYSTGFPKSLDVGKAIDKAGGVSPKEQAILLQRKRVNSGLSREQVAEHCGCTTSSVRDWEEGRSRSSGASVEYITPSNQYREKLSELLGYTSDERRLIGLVRDRRGDGTVYEIGHSGNIYGSSATEAAKQWTGWGTALKPALEPITVARKPLAGTVAATVLEWGTGAINVDGCRVPREDADDGWPNNLIHDGSDETTELLGSAARYFYCPKASKKDREDGCGSLVPQEANSTYDDGLNMATKVRTEEQASGGVSRDKRKNHHPTVKPTDLMRYLCRLVTPPGGVVLDPFMGSGSTGRGAVLEGFDFTGIEMDPDYLEIARCRIEAALATTTETP